MFLIRVAPLTALPSSIPQALDYFWSDPLLPGALVKATIGRRVVMAMVLDSLPAERAKLALKKASFTARKLDAVITYLPQATEGQILLAQWLSAHYTAPLGLCLKTALPSFIGKRGGLLTIKSDDITRTPKKDTPRPRFILTQPDTALAEIERSITTAKGQILIILPEVSLARWFAEHLKKHGPLLVHSGMKVKEYRSAYQGVLSAEARIVVGTRAALFLPWQDLTHIIVEDPMHEAYKSDMTPRYATADVARQLSTLHTAALTYLSPALGAVQQHLVDREAISVVDRKPHWPTTTLVGMEREFQTGTRSIFSRTAQDALLSAVEQHRPVLLYSPRRAYASMATCVHCKKPVMCHTCDIPMRFHRHGGKDDSMLICYHCAAFTPVPTQCSTCKAGTLKPSGLAGSQKIAEAAVRLFVDAGIDLTRIPILDSDLAQSDADEYDIRAQFAAMKYPVLVATQMIFSHRYEQRFHTIIAPQADALAYNPDFRTQERLIWQLEKLADFGPERMILQAMHEEDSVLAAASGRRWDVVLSQELADRKKLRWPPFCRIAKLTYLHTDRTVAARQAAITADKLRRAIIHEKISGTTLFGPTPALVQRAAGRWAWHLIIKTGTDTGTIARLIPYMGPGWSIDIDPRSIT